MRIIIFIIMMLICSCHQTVSDKDILDNSAAREEHSIGQTQEEFPDSNHAAVSGKVDSEKTMTRHNNSAAREEHSISQTQEEFPDSNHAAVSGKVDSEQTMTRHKEVIKIIYEYHLESLQGTEFFDMNEYLIRAEKNDPETNYELAGLTGAGSVLRGPLTKEQVEQESLEDLDPSSERVPYVPFGFINDRWIEFSSQYREGDEFYFHRTNSLKWGRLAGAESYMLIRKNECLGYFLTRFN